MDHQHLNALARTQHGLITRRQALDLGASDQRIRTLVETHRWDRARRGVFIVGAPPATWEQQLMAACLAAGPGAVACLRSAARLWGLLTRSGRLQLLVGDDRRVRLSGIDVYRSALLPPFDVTAERGIPTCTPARTIVDLSATQGVETIGAWVDLCLRQRQLHLLELRSCVARLAGPGRAGLDTVRAVLAKRLPGYDPGDSNLETRALAILHDAGLPAPTQQHRVKRPGGRDAFLDLAYPPEKVGIELDGWEFHRHRTAFDHDRDRRNDLTLLGWTMYQFTSSTTATSLATIIRSALDLANSSGQ